MKYALYSLHDTKSQSFAQPFYCPNRAVAIRHYMAAREDESSLVSKFPGDFRLYELALFDDSTGVLEPHAQPVLVTPTQE